MVCDMYYVKAENKDAWLVNGDTLLHIDKIKLKELKELEIYS